MSKFVIQKFVFTGSPISKTALRVQVFNALDGSPASLWSDYDGSTALFNHEVTATNGFLQVYVDAGLYNLRAFDEEENERWYYHLEAGEFHTESGKKHALQYQCFGNSPLKNASITLEVWDATDDSAASLWDDFDGSSARSDNTVTSTSGNVLVYTDPGRYNVRVYDNNGNESWLYDVEVGEWHTESNHVLQYPIFDGDPSQPALDDISVYVYDVTADDDASVFSDIDGNSALANPFVVSGGSFRCYVPGGRYTIEFYDGESLLYKLDNILVGAFEIVNPNAIFPGQKVAWFVGTKDEELSVIQTFTEGLSGTLRAAISLDMSTVAFMQYGGLGIEAYDITGTQTSLGTIEEPDFFMENIAISDDGSYLAVCIGVSPFFQLMDLSTQLFITNASSVPSQTCFFVEFNRAGDSLFVADSAGGSSSSASAYIMRYSVPGNVLQETSTAINSPVINMMRVNFQDTQIAVGGSTAGTDHLVILDTDDMSSFTAPSTQPTGSLTALAWSPNGAFLAAVDGGANLTVYDTSDWSTVTLEAHGLADVFSNCVFSSDSAYLMFSGGSGRTVVYDASDWSIYFEGQDSAYFATNVNNHNVSISA